MNDNKWQENKNKWILRLFLTVLNQKHIILKVVKDLSYNILMSV